MVRGYDGTGYDSLGAMVGRVWCHAGRVGLRHGVICTTTAWGQIDGVTGRLCDMYGVGVGTVGQVRVGRLVRDDGVSRVCMRVRLW